jgi:hypothetical protein
LLLNPRKAAAGWGTPMERQYPGQLLFHPSNVAAPALKSMRQ